MKSTAKTGIGKNYIVRLASLIHLVLDTNIQACAGVLLTTDLLFSLIE